MNLQEIMQRQTEINQRLSAIAQEASVEGVSLETLQALDAEIESLTQERSELTAKSIELRTKTVGTFTPVVNNNPEMEQEDKYATTAYRRAFKNWVTRGEYSPVLERTDASTLKTNISSVIIPTTITDKLYARNTHAGSLFARVTKTSYAPGIAVPALNLKPRLEWVAENGKPDRKGATTASVVFAGYKGQIRIAIGLEALTMSLDAFEAAVVDAILDACALGFDSAIVAGDGSGKPTGILTAAVYTGSGKHAEQLNNKTVGDYAAWVKIWAKLPLAKQPGAKLHINKSDWQAHILGMKDSTGKCIALETIGFGGAPVYTFMGREVVLLEDQGLPTFDAVTGNATASKATAFAFFFDDKDYYFNSNMQLTLKKYVDEETDETIHKATVVADGKPVDMTSCVVICRSADVA